MSEEKKQSSFPKREEAVLKFWEQEDIFQKSLEVRKESPRFTFYDGPPFATGLPHYGHLLAGTIKDVVPRYKTMKGFYVSRRFGWDCHGIPVESQVEKSEGLSGAKSIEDFGIDRFNESCRSIVLRYTKEWQSTVTRMGRWVDFNQTWHTMDLSFMESCWWAFKQLFEKGLVYEGYKVMPFSAALGTPLSNFEASENYRDVDDPSLTLLFPLKEDPQSALLVWTTTPWTLVSNLAAAVGPEVEYVKIRDPRFDQNLILAKARLESYYKDSDSYEILETMKGADLDGLHYTPPFSYFAHRSEEGAFRVVVGEHVSTDEGTGIVHTAPAFGEDDFYICKAHGIGPECPVDGNGRFTAEIPEYEGQFVKDADKAIIRRLKEENRVFHHGTCRHRYPFCPRTDTPLIYRAVGSWFVAVEKIKEKLLDANEQIHWTPGHIKHKRFGNWLEGARDWAISRSRYWGTPIPLWRSEDGDLLCLGSIAELEELTGTKITDLHRHRIDHLVVEKDGKEYKRIPEVFDCWFESGSMPYAQIHYPFENQEQFEQSSPADFIAEGLDQTRGWFYTLTVLSAALFDRPAFLNVIVNGIILAEDGTKMSKRLRNYPDPVAMLDQYGADAIRLYMLHSPAVTGDDLKFSEHGVELVLRQILIPFWNSFSFFQTYAEIYQWSPDETTLQHQPQGALDRWILSCLHQLIHEVERGMDAYDLSRAVEPFVGFVDQLTNWYIRRSRRRFWSEEDSADRRDAFATLYTVLHELCKVAAPFIPFLSEAIYRELRKEGDARSVHLCDYPHYDSQRRDLHLEQSMAAVQSVVSLGHYLRKEHKLKVRQPLSTCHVCSGDAQTLEFLKEQQHLIAEELNVKEVLFEEDESLYVQLSAKPNFRVLGKKVGKLMRVVQGEISSFGAEQLHALEEGKTVTVSVEGQEIVLTSEDVELDRKVKEGMVAANSGVITVVLDTELSDALVREGMARDLVRAVNMMRRNAGLEVTDRIRIEMKASPVVQQSFSEHQKYVCGELLALDVSFSPDLEGESWELGAEQAVIKISKAAL